MQLSFRANRSVGVEIVLGGLSLHEDTYLGTSLGRDIVSHRAMTICGHIVSRSVTKTEYDVMFNITHTDSMWSIE